MICIFLQNFKIVIIELLIVESLIVYNFYLYSLLSVKLLIVYYSVCNMVSIKGNVVFVDVEEDKVEVKLEGDI